MATSSSAAALTSAAEEQRWCIEQIEGNDEFETILHDHFKHPQEGRERSLFDNYDAPLDVMGKKSRKIKPFVRARKMQTYGDTSFQIPSHVGKVADVRATLAKLATDPNARHEPKEKSWLYYAYCCFKDPVILELANKWVYNYN